ncbi:TorF family putative porin [Sphingomonas sp.]|uniref:TorF family putative porin n=1 Tax=Sphingomonas sp. TaxID=28214 RepID=UPI001D673A5F|nr:TorF family putative porin [Sphingomonas sp.]MBX9797140.1 TorF family putative porin [Sphingomonas sp.]
MRWRAAAPLLLALPLLVAAPAAAQDTAPPKPVTVEGEVRVLSDYRARGISRSDNQPSAQLSVLVTHNASGIYGGVLASRVAGFGGSGGAPVEMQLYAGIRRPLAQGTVDAGLTWYLYPGGGGRSDFVELTGSYANTIGPLTVTAGLAYAPRQRSLGNFAGTPASRGQRRDALYVYTDAEFGVPGRPLSLLGHVGHARGSAGLGPNGFSLTPTGAYWDWSLGARFTRRRLSLTVLYVDTDITRAEITPRLPAFSEGGRGPALSGATGTVTLGWRF